MRLEPLAEKWTAFGWKVAKSTATICGSWPRPSNWPTRTDGPVMIIAETIKGKGVDFMENDPAWHYGGLSSDLIEKAKASIDRTAQGREA